MFEETKKYLSERSLKGKIIAIILILGISNSLIWQVVEPWNLEIINSNRVLWRWILISLTVLIGIVAFIFLYPKKFLERFGLKPGDTNLQTTVKSKGHPVITTNSGYQGQTSTLKGDFSNDEMDWQLKPSAHKASSVIFIYSPIDQTSFYIYIRVVSKDKSSQDLKWIRFDPQISIPDKCTDQREMGYPITAENQDGFLKTYVNIIKAVTETYGQIDWQFDKVLTLRVRGHVKVKSIVFNS